MGFTEKLAQRMQERNDNQQHPENTDEITEKVEAFEPSPFFGIDHARNYPACLDLRLSNGNYKALPYTYFIEISYEPSEGIEIITTTKKVTVTGRNLRLLYNFLVSYRVKFVQANIGNDLTEDKSLFVRDIKIEDAS